MRIAKDGKPFDMDNFTDEQSEEEVEIIQYLRPNGKRERVLASVGKEYVEKAENLILSAEELTTGEVALYARRKGQPDNLDVSELAVNGPGEKSPTNVLKKLIDQVSEKKKEEVR